MEEYVIVVELRVLCNMLEHFMLLLEDNARKTRMEDGCIQFDICKSKNKILLYEVYKDKKSFSFHLNSNHFKEFDNLTQAYIEEKVINFYELYDK